MRKDPRRNFETAQDGILLINGITGAIEDVNPFLISVLSYSYADFIGRELTVYDPAAVDACERVFHERNYVLPP